MCDTCFETRPKEPLTTTPEAADLAGVEYRTLHSWVERGLIQPAYPSTGIGHPAQLTNRDVRLVMLLAALRRAGCGIEILERAAADPERRRLDFDGGVRLTWRWRERP